MLLLTMIQKHTIMIMSTIMTKDLMYHLIKTQTKQQEDMTKAVMAIITLMMTIIAIMVKTAVIAGLDTLKTSATALKQAAALHGIKNKHMIQNPIRHYTGGSVVFSNFTLGPP